MPNAWYESGRTAVLKGLDANGTAISLSADTIKGVLIDFQGKVSGSPVPYGKAVTNATNATPIVVTATSHGYSNGDIVLIAGVLGNTAANGVFKIKNVAANTFELTNPDDDTNIAGTGAYTSGGNSVDLSTHVFLSDIDASCRSVSAALSSKTFNVPRGGVLDAADLVLPSVPALTDASAAEAIVLYKDISGNAAISPLLAIITDATGLPITPNGANETVVWDGGRLRILMI